MANPATFGDGTYGVSDDETLTGLYVASFNNSFASEMAQARDHNGLTVGFSVYDERIDITLDGVVKTEATLIAIAAGDAIAPADVPYTRFSGDLVVTGGSLSGTNTDFQTGNLTLVGFNTVT